MLKRLQRFTKLTEPQGSQADIGDRPLSYVPGQTNQSFREFNAHRTFRNPRVELIHRESNILTMGSCFANEVRAYLESRQIGNVSPSVSAEAQKLFDQASREQSSWGEWNGISNLQYYNTFTIRQEIEKAAGIWHQDPGDMWQVEIDGRQLYQCPYRRRIFTTSPDDLRTLTSRIDEAFRVGLESADLIVFTLGLTEVWRKKDNGLVACCEPGYCHGGGETETEFVASTFQENLDNVTATVDAIDRHFGTKNILLSVSPVPLGRTFRPLEISVANTESKSILRAVAGQVTAAHRHVHYFPSYEMCLSDPLAFRPDGRHVTRSKVDQIMGLFEACHVRQPNGQLRSK